jgi:hypothetical protein
MGITRAGHERIRQLLVVGAMAVIRHAANGGKAEAVFPTSYISVI